jgi:hypothetical protein
MGKHELEELCSLILDGLSGPGRGALVFVRADQEQKVRKLAIEVARSISQDEPAPIYVVQGHVRGQHGWPFSRIKKNPRLRIDPHGQIVTETGGLIFPQDRAIVLLVEYFDCLEPHDQRDYAHLVDGEGGEWALYEGSVLIGALLSAKPGQLEAGTANRGIQFDLA